MNSSNHTADSNRNFDDIINAIETRTLDIAGVKSRLLVLSIHPSSGEDTNEVLLRLALRSHRSISCSEEQDSMQSRNGIYQEPGTTVDSSLDARFSELGLSYSFKLNNDIKKETDSLVKRIKEDVPRALEHSAAPKIVFVDPVSPAVKISAAIVALLIPFFMVLYWTTSTIKAFVVVLLYFAASSIYKLITLRFRLK